MKRGVFRLICIVILWCAFDACARSNKENDYIVDSLLEATRLHTETISNLSERIYKLEIEQKKLSQKFEGLDTKWEIGSKELVLANSEIGKTQTWASVSLWLVVSLAFAFLAVMLFLFWPRKRAITGASADGTSRSKCPRCGWEHDPGDTVCKNPACKTQF